MTCARPDECFVSAWIACGYFDGSHFPDVSEMTQKDAIESLDPTGLMRQVGIPSDHAGESVSADRQLHSAKLATSFEHSPS